MTDWSAAPCAGVTTFTEWPILDQVAACRPCPLTRECCTEGLSVMRQLPDAELRRSGMVWGGLTPAQIADRIAGVATGSCLVCGEAVPYAGQKTCPGECRQSWARARRARATAECVVCGREIPAPDGQRTCAGECRRERARQLSRESMRRRRAAA